LLLVARIREDENEDKVWAAIEGSLQILTSKGIVPLYLSKRTHHMDSSLIVSAPSNEVLFDALIEILTGVRSADGLWIFPLVKPKFFEVPTNVGRDASRFLITITTRPSDAMRVYNAISSFRQTADLSMIYLAFTCQRYCDTLTLSVFAKSNDHVNRFVDQELNVVEGISRATITPMTKSKRLLPYAEMVRVLRNEVGDIDVARPMMDLSDLQ
jgi:hypothetical protein